MDNQEEQSKDEQSEQPPKKKRTRRGSKGRKKRAWEQNQTSNLTTQQINSYIQSLQQLNADYYQWIYYVVRAASNPQTDPILLIEYIKQAALESGWITEEEVVLEPTVSQNSVDTTPQSDAEIEGLNSDIKNPLKVNKETVSNGEKNKNQFNRDARFYELSVALLKDCESLAERSKLVPRGTPKDTNPITDEEFEQLAKYELLRNKCDLSDLYALLESVDFDYPKKMGLTYLLRMKEEDPHYRAIYERVIQTDPKAIELEAYPAIPDDLKIPKNSQW